MITEIQKLTNALIDLQEIEKTLPQPATYLPFLPGIYSVAPGLKPVEANFGNGSSDQRIFQIDCDYFHYLENKSCCREEGIEKYYVQKKENPLTQTAITQFIAKQLATEYPDYFFLEKSQQFYRLFNQLTEKQIRWTFEGELLENTSYKTLLDALADQVQEDLAIWKKAAEGDFISSIHLCSPNYWAPASKVGQPFSSVHEPVAGMESLRRRYPSMLDSLLQPKTWVRFAWGLSTDKRLNHHPEAPSYVRADAWEGRTFDPSNPQLFARVERQTLTGFPEAQAVLFTIRTYFEDVSKLTSSQQQLLGKAISSMSEATLRYKGLLADQDQILTWLNYRET